MAYISNSGKQPLQIDMTPMVDLGFLLITFFILTTMMGEAKIMNLIVPVDGDEMLLPESGTLSIVLDKNKTYVFTGAEEVAGREVSGNALRETLIDFKGIAALKQKPLFVVIKPSEDSRYQQLVAVLDEMSINNIRKYTIGSPDEAELKWIALN